MAWISITGRKLFYPLSLATIFTVVFYSIRYSFAKETIVTSVLFLSLIFAYLGENILPYGKNIEVGRLKRDLFYNLFNIVFIAALGTLTAYCLKEVIWFFSGKNTIFNSNQLGPFFLQLILIVLGVDLFRYFIHRAQHKYNFLWNFHAQHHSVNRTYSLNNFYSHPLDLFFRHAMPSYIFIVVGFGESALAAGLGIIGAIGIFSHCDADLEFGFLNKFLTTSQVHRWHHSHQFGAVGKNFAPSLALWDQIFGTYYFDSKHKGPISMGLGQEEEVRHPAESAWKFTWSPFKKFFDL